jgi:hypothetical protein
MVARWRRNSDSEEIVVDSLHHALLSAPSLNGGYRPRRYPYKRTYCSQEPRPVLLRIIIELRPTPRCISFPFILLLRPSASTRRFSTFSPPPRGQT